MPKRRNTRTTFNARNECLKRSCGHLKRDHDILRCTVHETYCKICRSWCKRCRTCFGPSWGVWEEVVAQKRNDSSKLAQTWFYLRYNISYFCRCQFLKTNEELHARKLTRWRSIRLKEVKLARSAIWDHSIASKTHLSQSLLHKMTLFPCVRRNHSCAALTK